MLKNSHLKLKIQACCLIFFQSLGWHFGFAETLISEFTRAVELGIRIQATAKESVSINNELDDAQIEWVIPDGAEVKKGDRLIKFFTEEILDDIVSQKQELLLSKLSSNTSLLQLKGEVQDKNDRLQALLGDIQILEAQREKLRSYPIQENVILAEQKLDVKRETFNATKAEYERESERYKAKMISEKQWRKSKLNYDIDEQEVKHSELLLELEQLSATERSLRMMDLKIQNAKIQQQELEWGIEIQNKIIELKRKNIKKRVEISETQLERVEKEYSFREIFSPQDGLVSYMPRLIRSIQEGSTIHKGIGLFNIVDPKKLEFIGSLRAKDVNLFREGDPALLIFKHTGLNREIKAEIKKINRNPSDIAGESSEYFSQDKASGIKIYDVVIQAESDDYGIFPGTYGEAILKSKEPFKGPAVPMKDIDWKDGQARLSFGGIYKKIHGKAIQDLFFLEDRQLLGKAYQKEGQERELSLKNNLEKPKTKHRLQLNAEMAPLSAELISVPRFRYWRGVKMDWVSEDGVAVKAGDKLFVMGSESSVKNKEKMEKDIQRLEDEVTTLQKEHQNLLREKSIKQQLLNNTLEIAKLELETAELNGDVLKIYTTMNQLKQKNLQKEFAQWSQVWSKNKEQVIGEVELLQLERDLKQIQLEEERLKLQYHLAIKPDEIRISAAKVNLQKENYDFESSMRSLEVRELNSQNRLNEMQRQLERDKRQYQKLLAEQELLTIRAPKDGMIKFLKVWDGLRMSTAAPGYSMYGSMSLATLYDVTDMMIKLPLNESLYKNIDTNVKISVFVPSVTEFPLEAQIMKVDSVFQSKLPPDLQSESLYGSHERLGEQVFYVHIKVKTPEGLMIKPGAVATVNLEWDYSGKIN